MPDNGPSKRSLVLLVGCCVVVAAAFAADGRRPVVDAVGRHRDGHPVIAAAVRPDATAAHCLAMEQAFAESREQNRRIETVRVASAPATVAREEP